MSNKEELVILKLGGSLITDKTSPFSVRYDVIRSCVNQISKAIKKMIIVHGGGSFGHPVAKEYKINNGLNENIPNQLIGLIKTHQAMLKLNSIVLDEFSKKSCRVFPLQPSAIFLKTQKSFVLESSKIVKKLLKLNIFPILYGDVVIGGTKHFSIISGDDIIRHLCESLNRDYKLKVIFAIDKDGILKKSDDIESHENIYESIDHKELDIIFSDLKESNKIDVTGGMRGKLTMIRYICQMDIPVQIINGLKKDYILKALIGKDLKSTYIY